MDEQVRTQGDRAPDQPSNVPNDASNDQPSVAQTSLDVRAPASVAVQYTTLASGEPVIIYGPVQQDARYDYEQAQNDYGALNDCGIVAVRDVLAQHGVMVSEDALLRHAAQYSEMQGVNLETRQITPDTLGETTISDEASILHDYGVPADVRTNQSVDDLAQQVQSGDTAIIGVDMGYLYDDPNYVGDGHAVEVVSVVRDEQTGQIVGFYLNDPNYGDKGPRFVSVQTIAQAWSRWGGQEVVVPPIPAAPS